ncbi:hypothetical protein yaldo0001_8960 [Yersinia aldovae ATCC 35236]|nr:hypothetical protein yaldo0001_8960 [Yersinia aldovae ATCC 35236]
MRFIHFRHVLKVKITPAPASVLFALSVPDFSSFNRISKLFCGGHRNAK